MKKRILIIMLGIAGICAARTNTISLSECYQKALEVHPRQAGQASRRKISRLNKTSLNARWLPTLEINAKASYISDVVSFDETLGQLPLPIALPEMPHEHYTATLDVKQVIYDGGAIRQGKALEEASLAADLAALETDVYRIHEQINQVYFGLLALQQQNAIIQLFQENLTEQRLVLEAGIKNGMMLPGTLDALDAELLKIDQKLAELAISEKYRRTVLATLIGIPVNDYNFLLPEITINFSSPIDRPENHLFEAKKAQLHVSRKALFSQRLPTAFAFGSFGYGQPPGNNFFASDFESYYSVGAGIRWNIYDWNITRRTRETLQLQQEIIATREQDFNRSISIALQTQHAEIEKLESMLQRDTKIIQLRERISRSTASQLHNGTINSTEYVRVLNEEKEAALTRELHKIQLTQAKINYLTISGQIEN